MSEADEAVFGEEPNADEAEDLVPLLVLAPLTLILLMLP